ncbi:MAG: pyridoxamine 5'-phosphate oxidase family protein [Acidobacteria bacterium]|nr:pyridoxamine 5'-phosphate oxidase family protein [Acidobacteriota bacterium]
METTPPIPFDEPRRRDRAIEDEAWIRALLTRVPLGVLATSGAESPGLNPNLFVFDPDRRAIYLHTARQGQTRRHVEERPRVTFCAAEMGRLLPAEAAVHFSVEYASVVATGRSVVVDDPAEATRALELFMAKYAPHLQLGRDYEGIRPKDLARTSVFRIDIESWSAKGKTSDAADAYRYEEVVAPACPWTGARAPGEDAAEPEEPIGRGNP